MANRRRDRKPGVIPIAAPRSSVGTAPEASASACGGLSFEAFLSNQTWERSRAVTAFGWSGSSRTATSSPQLRVGPATEAAHDDPSDDPSADVRLLPGADL
jgi:hypothetical protein